MVGLSVDAGAGGVDVAGASSFFGPPKLNSPPLAAAGAGAVVGVEDAGLGSAALGAPNPPNRLPPAAGAVVG